MFIAVAGIIAWLWLLIAAPVPTLVVTAAVGIFGGLFLTSGGGDGAGSHRWSNDFW